MDFLPQTPNQKSFCGSGELTLFQFFCYHVGVTRALFEFPAQPPTENPSGVQDISPGLERSDYPGLKAQTIKARCRRRRERPKRERVYSYELLPILRHHVIMTSRPEKTSESLSLFKVLKVIKGIIPKSMVDLGNAKWWWHCPHWLAGAACRRHLNQIKEN